MSHFFLYSFYYYLFPQGKIYGFSITGKGLQDQVPAHSAGQSLLPKPHMLKSFLFSESPSCLSLGPSAYCTLGCALRVLKNEDANRTFPMGLL